jgi:membrane-associated phospholipid phosphatase
MIWHDPGFPSLLVTYDVGNDFFFSGHTALAVFGAIELARSRRPLPVVLGVAIAVFEIVAVIVLRAHWTLDVYAAVVTAFCAAGVANWLGPYVDGALAPRRKPATLQMDADGD